MANWYGFARSNYFKVKNREALESELNNFEGLELVDGEDGAVAIIARNTEFGGWPERDPPEGFDVEDYEPVYLREVLAPHLVDGEVAILIEAGAEKLRYITGTAVAVHSSGRELEVDLNDIYALVKREFGVVVSPAEY